jgi:signal transduction histidine kinase
LADLARANEAVLGDIAPTSRPYGLAQQARKAAERATALTHQLLTLAGPCPGVSAPDLNLVIAGLSEALLRLLGGRVALTLYFNQAPLPVRGDATTVEQIVLNLAICARDAMPSGGKLTIETLQVDVAAGGRRVHANLREGRYALLRVRDAEHVLDDKVRALLDEMLASPRPPDPEEGPGLPVACSLVRRIGGAMTVCSEPGFGTCSAAYLPQAADTSERAPQAPKVQHPAG